jgi:hypothetical protein
MEHFFLGTAPGQGCTTHPLARPGALHCWACRQPTLVCACPPRGTFFDLAFSASIPRSPSHSLWRFPFRSLLFSFRCLSQGRSWNFRPLGPRSLLTNSCPLEKGAPPGATCAFNPLPPRPTCIHHRPNPQRPPRRPSLSPLSCWSKTFVSLSISRLAPFS